MREIEDSPRFVSSDKLNRLSKWTDRKPVIALMGEFSAGKSTLLNMLIGRSLLPMQVTATRLPPVWARYGTGPSYRIDQDGVRHDVDLHDPASIPMAETRYIRIYHDSGMLKKCDIIDTPGISDPNIPLSVWIKTIAYANSVLWCTPANQAWRESERGTWESLPARLRAHSLLLVTRADKLLSEIDRDKIDRRLQRETGALFGSRHFISLTHALKSLEGEGDSEAWFKSGAQEFMESLSDIIEATYKNRKTQFTRYKIGESGRVIAPSRPVTDPAGEKTSVFALRPTRVAAQPDNERGLRPNPLEAERRRSELRVTPLDENESEENQVTSENTDEKPKSRPVFSLRREKPEDSDLPQDVTKSSSDEVEKPDTPRADVGFRHQPETKAEGDQATETEEELSDVAETVEVEVSEKEESPVDALGSDDESHDADDEFYEDDYSEAPGPEEVSNVIARIDSAIPDAASAELDEIAADENKDESEDTPEARSASDIWQEIVTEQEIETVAQMKDAITRLVAELDENAALSGTTDLISAHG